MNWYIGQSIVAIKDCANGKFKKGTEFTIRAIRVSRCCGMVILDIGLTLPSADVITCSKCRRYATMPSYTHWKGEFNFAPLDQDISELTELLVNTDIIEK